MNKIDRNRISQPHRGGWWHFSHGADIGICGFGPSSETAFEQAALALSAAVTDQPIRAETRVIISCAAPDLELLLVDWLNALIFEMATRRMLFGRFEVIIRDGVLVGSAWGEPADPTRHQPAVEAKGATYTELKVAQDTNGIWLARCVVDV